MSTFHDDRTHASNPGGISLSVKKLRQFHPEPSFRWPDALIAEHLAQGDARAAVVVSTAPLRVAAYTDELDCVALLTFPPYLVSQYRLKVGSRLLTVNTYTQGPGSVASDLRPGPRAGGVYTDFWALIADFLSDDLSAIEERKKSIEAAEWTLAEAQGRAALATNPEKVRDGRPYNSARNPSFVYLVLKLVVLMGVLALVLWRATRR